MFKFLKNMFAGDESSNVEPEARWSIVKIRAEVLRNSVGLSGTTEKIYLFEKIEEAPKSDSLNRIFGPAVGVFDDRWPKYDDRNMTHVITLDLNQTPMLKSKFKSEARAIAVFISDPVFNEAYIPFTSESAVLVLTQDEVSRGISSITAEPREDHDYATDDTEEACSFCCHELDVPIEIFLNEEESDESDSFEDLRDAIYCNGYAGGAPLWLQGEDHDGNYIMQFDQMTVDINLGDSGVMYVFGETAFWQCH